MNYKKAVAKIAERRRAELEAYERRVLDALQSDEEYRSAEFALRALTLDAAAGRPTDAKQAAALRARKAAAEQRLGLFPPAPHCARCGDTGLLGGKPCACAVNRTLAESGDVKIPLHDFSAVDFSVFSPDCRDEMQKTYGIVRRIIAEYPRTRVRNVVLAGGTGTGKTYLAGCAASAMLGRGESAAALTAFAANNRFLQYHTTFDQNKTAYLEPLIDCELLVIDDLGTESVLKNVTVEYLYQVLNERMLAGKLTMVTTNLSGEAILARYGERIYSRLFDKSLCYAAKLRGKDLRRNA